MSELSGLELRRAACEVLGWHAGSLEGLGHDKIPRIIEGWWNPEHLSWQLELPAIESDPSVSEPLFLEWCEKNGYMWDIYTTQQRTYSCAVYLANHNGTLAHVYGATPSEARARAIVKAGGR